MKIIQRMQELNTLKVKTSTIEDLKTLISNYCKQNDLQQVEKDYLGIIDVENNRYYCMGDPSCSLDEIREQGMSAHPLLNEDEEWEVKVGEVTYKVGDSNEILYN